VEQIVQLDPGLAGVPASFVFKANSLFDPNDTGVGHQPLGFDQIMPFFDKYCVIHANIRVTFVNTDTAATQGMIVGVKVADSSVGVSNIADEIERGTMKYRLLTARDDSKNMCTITHQVAPAKFLGISRPLSEDRLKGTISSSPLEGVYFIIVAQPNASVDAGAVRCLVQIDYTAIFTEPKEIATS